MEILNLIGRTQPILAEDIRKNAAALSAEVSKSAFLVLGGAGSIGQAVTEEIFKRHPKNCMWSISVKII